MLQHLQITTVAAQPRAMDAAAQREAHHRQVGNSDALCQQVLDQGAGGITELPSVGIGCPAVQHLQAQARELQQAGHPICHQSLSQDTSIVSLLLGMTQGCLEKFEFCASWLAVQNLQA